MPIAYFLVSKDDNSFWKVLNIKFLLTENETTLLKIWWKLKFIERKTWSHMISFFLVLRGHSKSSSLTKMAFFEFLSPHVALCHFLLQPPSPLCHSLKSGQLWYEREEFFYINSCLSMPNYIKEGRKDKKLQF